MMVKYKKHSLKTQDMEQAFYFLLSKDQLCFLKIKKIKARKATQITDIPTKTLKENTDIFLADIVVF